MKKQKKLTGYEYATLWSGIEIKSEKLLISAKNQNPVEFYKLLDELNHLKTKMKIHFMAKDLNNV